jgi:hypothetical protein
MTLLGRSEAFQALIYQINKFLEPVIEAFGTLLDALWPAIDAILQLVFVGLEPVMWILTNIIAPVLNATAKIIAGIWNAFATAINWALGWLGVKLSTIDLGASGGIPREPKDQPGETPGSDPKPVTPVTGGAFGNGTDIKVGGANSSIATAVVGISADQMTSIVAPLVDLGKLQVNFLGQIAANFNGEKIAKMQLDAAMINVENAGQMKNFMTSVIRKLDGLGIKGNQSFTGLQVVS